MLTVITAVRNRLVFLILLWSCQQQHVEDKELQILSVGLTPYVGEVATFIALEEGFFEEEGLAVHIVINTSGVESMKQLLDGKVDVAHSSEAPLMHALVDSTFHPHAIRKDLRVISNMILSNRLQKIIIRKENPIINPTTENRSLVGLVRNSQSEYHFDSFLLEHQLEPDRFELVNLTPAEIKPALQNGVIQATAIWEPYATDILRSLGKEVVEAETKLVYNSLWLAVVPQELLLEKPALAIGYLKALRKAQEFILKNPSRAIDILEKNTQMPRDLLEMVRDELDYYLSLGEKTLIVLDWQQEWMNKRGIGVGNRLDPKIILDYKPLSIAFPQGISVLE
jgi:sulfonate transport system substrate-binding protein